ncbi:type II toxin-antitoxin system death-on-curing family toxin [Tomitella gaofuii]|uniref:type II toxin-antitoxin system death-on-curing family toxin n=1 Tax=Tomitella gaofuii TaxID=2760083 RepID=UPI0015F8BEB8|nr:type II toxin-antitoxin system death-on-curing family toxin [Tomitella gaofuii]
MSDHLDREDVLHAGSIAVGHRLDVRDYGLLDAAVARPRATVFGIDAYEGDFEKAAALLQSLARNHAFVDGNKRTAWASAWVFLHLNGHELDPSFDVDGAEAFMEQAATHSEMEVPQLASRLRGFALSADD